MNDHFGSQDAVGSMYSANLYDPNFGPTPDRDDNIVWRIYTTTDAHGIKVIVDSPGIDPALYDFSTVLPNL